MWLMAVLTVFISLTAHAQTVTELQKHYSGKTEWDPASGTITFTSSGIIDFKRDKEMSGIWEAPGEISKIFINANVCVTGQFTVCSNCTIEGADKETSVIFGTATPELLHNKGLDEGGNCMPYSSVFGVGKITIHVNNLTILNPVAYMWTGRNGAVIHLYRVRGIDNRGGWHNHSDGIQAADRSTVRDCYMETGDDAIKVYNEILVENTTIRMIQNTVPIQLGWGSYGNNARGVFRNLTIIGDKGRSRIPGVIVGRQGKYSKRIEIDGMTLVNTNAALVSLYEKDMELDLSISNANISVKQFWGETNGVCRSSINGSTKQENSYRAQNR